MLNSALQNFDFTLPAALNGQTVDFQLVLVNTDGVNDFAFDQNVSYMLMLRATSAG